MPLAHLQQGGMLCVAVLLLLLLLAASEPARDAQHLYSLGRHYHFGAERGVDCQYATSPPVPSGGSCWDPANPHERAAAAANPCGYCAMQCYLAARNATHTHKSTSPFLEYQGMLNDLGLLLVAHDEYEAAVEVFEEAVELSPQASNVLALANWAGLESSLMRFDRAEQLYARALSILDGSEGLAADSTVHAKVLYNFGVLKQKRGALREADVSYATALALDPQGMYLAQGNLACNLCRHGTIQHHEQAQELFREAVARAERAQDSGSALTLAHQMIAGVTPEIHLAASDILPTRRRLAQGLRAYLSSPLLAGQLNPYDMVGPSSLGYYLIYNGYEDAYLRQLQAAVYWRAASHALRYTAPFLTAAPAADGGRLARLERGGYSYTLDGEKHALFSLVPTSSNPHSVSGGVLRVGFASAFFYHHSVGLLLRGVIKGLAARPRLFRVIVFCVGQRGSDGVTEQLRGAVGESNMHFLAGSLQRVRSQIAAQELDVLVYGEIGMDQTDYFLSFARLARRSIVFWGHAVTSGVTRRLKAGDGSGQESIGPDYFLSSNLFESGGAAAQEEYSERLLLMRGLVASFERPLQPLSRADFAAAYGGAALTSRRYLLSLDESLAAQLPPEGEPLVLFGAPQTLYKMHPHFDEIIADILAADPSFRVVLLSGSEPFLAQATKARLGRRLGDAMDRVLFTGLLDERAFITLCSMLDVALDPFPVGGGRSSLEILSTGTPIVLLYNRTSILQLTHAMYTAMGVDTAGLVASSSGEYVAMAVALGQSASRRAALRREILSRSHRLYSDGPSGEETVDEWQKALLFVCAAPRPLPGAARGVKGEAPRSSLWVDEEYEEATFTYAPEPLVLEQVRMALYLSSSGELEEASFLVPRRLVGDTSRDEELSYFEQTFTVDGERVVRMLVTGEEGWERRCLRDASLALPEVTHRLTALSVCTAAGRHITRTEGEAVQRFGLLLQTRTVEAYLPVTVHRGDDLNLLFSTLLSDLDKATRVLNDLYGSGAAAEADLQRALGDSFRELRGRVEGLLLHGGLDGVSLRHRAFHRVFRASLETALLPGVEALAAEVSSCLLSSGAAGMALEVSADGGAVLADESITLAVTSCRRLDRFTATMDAIIAAFASAGQLLPGPLVSRVLVVDDGSPSEEQREMARKYGGVAEFVFKGGGGPRGHASSLNTIMTMAETKYLLLIEDDMLLLSRPELHPSLLPDLASPDAVAGAHPFIAALEGAREVLRGGGVQQMLFNSQVSRACAEGTAACALDDLARGGWAVNESALPYSLHEFGCADSSKWDLGAEGRIHAFAYWPGFSLNPGLWDMHEVARLRSCHGGRLFSEDPSVPMFEQAFSALTLAAGFRVGYLPAVFFRHTGEVSAYVLNGMRRPVDV